MSGDFPSTAGSRPSPRYGAEPHPRPKEPLGSCPEPLPGTRAAVAGQPGRACSPHFQEAAGVIGPIFNLRGLEWLRGLPGVTPLEMTRGGEWGPDVGSAWGPLPTSHLPLCWRGRLRKSRLPRGDKALPLRDPSSGFVVWLLGFVSLEQGWRRCGLGRGSRGSEDSGRKRGAFATRCKMRGATGQGEMATPGDCAQVQLQRRSGSPQSHRQTGLHPSRGR